MQQPCSRCGYISDRPARFCRQCGSALFNETEASSATTRNYAPPQAPPQYGPQFGAYPYAPNQPMEEQTPDTSPFYRPPMAHLPPQYPVPAQTPSGTGKWVLIGLAMFIAMALLAGGLLFFLVYSVRDSAQTPQAAEQPEIPGSIPAPPPPPPAPPAPGSETSAQLEDFKYPNAKVVEEAHIPTTEAITLVTSDKMEVVKAFYDRKFKEKFKNSSTSLTVEDERTYTYTHLSKPLVNITVEPDEDDAGKVRISITLTDIAIPDLTGPRR